MIEHQLHDINNKLNSCVIIIRLLNNKYQDENLLKLQHNLDRIADLVSISYEKIQKQYFLDLELIELQDLNLYFSDAINEANLNYNFNLSFQMDLPTIRSEKYIRLEKRLLVQIIDNLMDNSQKASASKIIFRLLTIEDRKLILEIVDNGVGNYQSSNLYDNIPHGIGTELIKHNANIMNASTSWANRLDSSGKIVRIYFDILDAK